MVGYPSDSLASCFMSVNCAHICICLCSYTVHVRNRSGFMGSTRNSNWQSPVPKMFQNQQSEPSQPKQPYMRSSVVASTTVMSCCMALQSASTTSQYAVAWLITDHIAPIPQSLHWFPVHQRVAFKLSMLVSTQPDSSVLGGRASNTDHVWQYRYFGIL